MTARDRSRRRASAAARSVGIGAAAVLLAAATTAPDAPVVPPTTQPSTAPAAPPVADDPGGTVALIHRLGADEEEDRAAAQRQLVALGDAAVDALRRAADADPDPEVRSRAAAALAQIRDRAVNGPTLVTLRLTRAAPADALADLGRQAHADITSLGGGPFVAAGRSVTIEANRRPFWDVLADVCGQLDACPSLGDPSGPGSIRLLSTPRSWIASAPHQVVGPFWVGVSGLYRSSSVDLSGPPVADDQFFARLIVFPEPKLTVTQVSPLTVREAVDDAGNSLLPTATAALTRPFGRTFGRLPVRTVEARLHYPQQPGRRITTLAGDLSITLAQGAQRLEVDNVTGSPTVTHALPGVSARVGVSPASTGQYDVTIECRRAGLADGQWFAMTARVNDLTVEDAAGRALTPLGGWTADSGNSDVSFKATRTFARQSIANVLANGLAAAGGGNAVAGPAPAGEPRRVVWTVADRFRIVTVPVAFHDLPMP
jgi:hypothetical protein